MEVNIHANGNYFAGIKGIGHYVPKNIVTNDDLAEKIDTSDEWIRSKLGIEARRLADDTEALSDIAIKAAQRALENAKVKPEEIDLIILARLDPDHLSPATSCLVQSKLGAKNAGTFDLSVGGCPGSVYSLAVGADFVKSGACKNVLVISGDINSRNMINWSDRNTCCFFGDGIGAAVISRIKEDKGIKSYQLNVAGDKYHVVEIPAGGTVLPLNKENINSNERYFRMDGKAVWKFAITVGAEVVEDVTRMAGTSVQDLDLVIFHQANINIVKNCMEELQLPMEKTYTTIEKYGNTGGGSVTISLSEAVEKGIIKSGDKIALSAFGAGLAWAGMYIEWCDESDFL
ncbi:MAG: ketoacyl-ACP synthase III [Halanaerobiales bacterium]|nr:ketoacyl-ACP synthase III [Halanaerobiales bacterium]